MHALRLAQFRKGEERDVLDPFAVSSGMELPRPSHRMLQSTVTVILIYQ